MTEKTLEEQLGELLRERGASISTAESCTGGLIASRITDVPGSSAYMMGGVVSYSNEAKGALLNVRQATMMAYGAVSEQTAREMAAGAKELFHTDYAVSVTGIAGPGGNTSEKPLGLTFIGLAAPEGVSVVRHIWEGDRISNKRQSADAALQLVIKALGG